VLGYGLTTAQFSNRMPDHPSLLQTYVLQITICSEIPGAEGFLAFWQEKLDGPLFAVTVAHSKRSSRLNCAPSTACSGCIERIGRRNL